jgi:hypothetical protein
VAFSCKGRGLCPSRGAKRAAELGAFLVDEVVEDVGHAQWVFTIPKMLRVHVLVTRGGWKGSGEWVPAPKGRGSAPGQRLRRG